MTAAEILRKLADIVDNKEFNPSNAEITNRPEIVDVEMDTPTDTASIEDDAQVNVKSMVPPLQQKFELMKRMAGEESCDVCHSSPCECDDGAEDEMTIMRRNAGIAPIVVAIADEDEPFDLRHC
jgi:hypothetical protein